jgi:hypothetical protein
MSFFRIYALGGILDEQNTFGIFEADLGGFVVIRIFSEKTKESVVRHSLSFSVGKTRFELATPSTPY